MYVCWVGFALYDIQHGDVAGALAGCHGDHAILGLEQAAHDV